MIEDIPRDVLLDCAQLVKHNSIKGELDCVHVSVIYTRT